MDIDKIQKYGEIVFKLELHAVMLLLVGVGLAVAGHWTSGGEACVCGALAIFKGQR